MAQGIERRLLIKYSAGLMTAALAGLKPTERVRAKEVPDMKPPIDTVYVAPGQGVVTGKGSGDFDFLAGEWKIRHQRLKDGTKNEWQTFDSSASVHRVMHGMGSIEELRKPDGSDMGLGVRVWLPQEKKWADHWTSAANGVVNPPQLGVFVDGEGVFISEEEVDGVKWQYRGIWDRITPRSCRWHQSASSDGGKNWDWSWWMQWLRAE
jgi:hypothetical protein